jgi:hypothetical protein
MVEGLAGQEEGDPRKIAEVIVKLAASDDVPRRLVLGVSAEQWVQQAEAARAAEAAKWIETTQSTVFPDAVAPSGGLAN